MGIFDWLKSGQKPATVPSEISRRDFFARVAGRTEPAPPPSPSPPPDPAVLHTFHVAGFPYHDGPVLVPTLRVGLEFDLVPEPGHPTDPSAIRIQWKRDHLGYVPPDFSGGVRALLDQGIRLRCRASRVSPNAELAKVLEVEILRPPEPEPENETEPND